MKLPNIGEIFDYLIPESRVYLSQWADIFIQEDKKKFTKLVSIFSIFCALAYIAHYHFVDMPQKKEPQMLWFLYRYIAAGFCLSIMLLYKKVNFRRYSRVPYFLACCVLCYFQGQTMIWHHGTPYQYGFMMAFVMSWTVQVNMMYSCFAYLVMVGLQLSPLVQAQVPMPHIVSHTILFFVAIIFTRSSYKLEVDKFISDMEADNYQKQNIQNTIYFSEQLLAFLPKQIGNRLKALTYKNKMSTANATYSVLKPKVLPAACLFTDIRGYTKKSKNLEFISNSAIFEIQSLSQEIDNCNGISRKIGDLIFAYFDSEDLKQNILSSSIASIKVWNRNSLHNQSATEENKITRKIILTCGDCVVGNLGSTDSSVEITALGSAVNLCARIDEISKHEIFITGQYSSFVLLSNEFANCLVEVCPNVSLTKITISDIGLSIRDFSNEIHIWGLEPNNFNLDLLVKAQKIYLNEYNNKNGIINIGVAS